MSRLGQTLSQYWEKIQGTLFPWLEEELEPLTENQKQLVTTLELIRLEEFVSTTSAWMGRPPESRRAIVRSFIAKSVYNLPTTRCLLDRLDIDKNLRRICGWETKREVPSESTFSRAFAEFSETELPRRVHEALIKNAYQEEMVGHISRDSTAIEARERPLKKQVNELKDEENILPQAEEKDCETESASEKEPSAKQGRKIPKKKRKRGRPRKGEERTIEEKLEDQTRIQKQLKMTLPEMLEDLPKGCDRGSKKNSKGYGESWNGYKLHLDSADGTIPISAILTSASVHDSQVAIPLATVTSLRVQNFYDLMDSAYDVKEIHEHSRGLNHVPIIDVNPRRNTELKIEQEAEQKARNTLNWKPAEATRYNARTTAERTNARLKDEFGGRTVRVKGHAKVFCHLMFGVLALAADQLMRLAT